MTRQQIINFSFNFAMSCKSERKGEKDSDWEEKPKKN